MILETLVTSILKASVTGAGLVIAFYALIAHMADKIFERKHELLEEKRIEIEQVWVSRVRGRGELDDENLKSTTRRLDELFQEIGSIKTFPTYLGPLVIIDFVFFLVTTLLSLQWLVLSPEIRANFADSVIPLFFLVSVVLFLIVGVWGIGDVMIVMKDRFRRLMKQKEEIRKGAEEVGTHIKLVEETLTRVGVRFQKSPLIKTNGTALIPDFAIPSAKNPRYLIEFLTWPRSRLIYRLSIAYQKVKSQTSARTILISDFGDRLSLMDLAKAYWDFVVDLQNLNQLKGILEE